MIFANQGLPGDLGPNRHGGIVTIAQDASLLKMQNCWYVDINQIDKGDVEPTKKKKHDQEKMIANKKTWDLTKPKTNWEYVYCCLFMFCFVYLQYPSVFIYIYIYMFM